MNLFSRNRPLPLPPIHSFWLFLGIKHKLGRQLPEVNLEAVPLKLGRNSSLLYLTGPLSSRDTVGNMSGKVDVEEYMQDPEKFLKQV